MFVIVSNTKTNKKLIQKFLFRCWLDLGWVWTASSQKSKISPSQCMSCRFRLPLPREKSFPVACHPSRLLLCHEVCKHPGHLPNEPDSLLSQNIESLEVLLQKAGSLLKTGAQEEHGGQPLCLLRTRWPSKASRAPLSTFSGRRRSPGWGDLAQRSSLPSVRFLLDPNSIKQILRNGVQWCRCMSHSCIFIHQ